MLLRHFRKWFGSDGEKKCSPGMNYESLHTSAYLYSKHAAAPCPVGTDVKGWEAY